MFPRNLHILDRRKLPTQSPSHVNLLCPRAVTYDSFMTRTLDADMLSIKRPRPVHMCCRTPKSRRMSWSRYIPATRSGLILTCGILAARSLPWPTSWRLHDHSVAPGPFLLFASFCQIFLYRYLVVVIHNHYFCFFHPIWPQSHLHHQPVHALVSRSFIDQ